MGEVKSCLGEVRTYKNNVWAKSGLTKIRFGQSRDVQKSDLGEAGPYKIQSYTNQFWEKWGHTKIEFGQCQDLQKSSFDEVGTYKNHV